MMWGNVPPIHNLYPFLLQLMILKFYLFILGTVYKIMLWLNCTLYLALNFIISTKKDMMGTNMF